MLRDWYPGRVGIMSAIHRMLTSRMRAETRDELQAYFDRNLPSPRWVESLLAALESNTTVENVLILIRNDPSQAFRYCTNLSIGLYFQMMGLEVEFLDAESTQNFDLRVDERLAVEVKLLDDVSNWSLLSSRIMEIPSSYMVWVTTDLELTQRRVDVLAQEIRRAVTGRTEPSFGLETSNARLTFYRTRTRRTLPVLSSGTFGVDLRDLRRLFSSRIDDARRQLARSSSTKMVVIDVQRSQFFRSTTDAVFCGEVGTRFSLPNMTPLSEFRNPGGILTSEGFWEGLDAVMVFYGYEGDNPRRMAYYARPGLPGDSIPPQVGPPDSCDNPTYID